MKIPCKDCITLAICKQKDEVDCIMVTDYCLYPELGASLGRILLVKDYLNKTGWSVDKLNVILRR